MHDPCIPRAFKQSEHKILCLPFFFVQAKYPQYTPHPLSTGHLSITDHPLHISAPALELKIIDIKREGRKYQGDGDSPTQKQERFLENELLESILMFIERNVNVLTISVLI